MGSSGWNRPSAANQPRKAPKKPSAMRGIAAGLVAVAVAAVCIFLFMGKGEKSAEKAGKKPTRIAEVTPAPAPTNKVEVAKEPKPRDPWAKDKDGYYHYVSAEGNERRTKNRLVIAALLSDKPGVQAPHLIRDEEKNPSRYKSEMQQELHQFLRPGKFFDISRNYKDDEALQMCETPIVYNYDDPDEVLEEKKAMEDLCKDMAQYIRNGGHADDYLGKLAHRQSLEREAIRTTRDEVLKLAREGKPEEAKSALATYNKYLEGKGIQALSMDRSIDFMYKKGRKERGEE